MKIFVARSVGVREEQSGTFRTKTRQVSVFKAEVRMSDFLPEEREALDTYRDKFGLIPGAKLGLFEEAHFGYEEGKKPEGLTMDRIEARLENYHVIISAPYPRDVEKALKDVLDYVTDIMCEIRFFCAYSTATVEERQV